MLYIVKKKDIEKSTIKFKSFNEQMNKCISQWKEKIFRVLEI